MSTATSARAVRGMARRLRAARAVSAGRQRALLRERTLATRLRNATRPVPAGPVELDDVRLTARHRPADRFAGVGGDWCDWQSLPGHRILLDVGDVVGHGLGAVDTMVRLRHTIAALAAAGLEPQSVLATANALLWRTGRAEMATALVAVYDPALRELRWASAGHPPLILTDPGGDARSCASPPGMMLGVDPHARYEPATTRLDPGDGVVLYTDGFVESRCNSIDQGIGTLVAALRECRPAEGRPIPLCDAVGRLQPRSPDDDACMLAADVTARRDAATGL
jgi:serine phosphatase RsbU (regulator of sigma subunit)